MSEVKSRPDGWWIAWEFEGASGECGPYTTKAEAEDDRVGLERTFKHINERTYWTTEKK